MSPIARSALYVAQGPFFAEDVLILANVVLVLANVVLVLANVVLVLANVVLVLANVVLISYKAVLNRTRINRKPFSGTAATKFAAG